MAELFPALAGRGFSFEQLLDFFLGDHLPLPGRVHDRDLLLSLGQEQVLLFCGGFKLLPSCLLLTNPVLKEPPGRGQALLPRLDHLPELADLGLHRAALVVYPASVSRLAKRA